MKKEYDFSKGKRGAIEPTPVGKSRITIRLDNEIIDWFRKQTEMRGGGNYQTLINDALKEHIMGASIEATVKSALQAALRSELPSILCSFKLTQPFLESASNEGIRSDISTSLLIGTATSTDTRRLYAGN